LKTETKRHVRLNKRALIVAVILVVIAIPTVLVVWSIQSRREGFNVLALAKESEQAGDLNKAIRHLSAYHETHPDDRTALALLARLLAETARDRNSILYAASVNERLLRLDPDAPDSQDVRRRLVELYVHSDELLKASSNYKRMPERFVNESRAVVAETIAQQLFAKGRTNIPKDYRLRAEAEEGLVAPGNPKALEDAIADYKKALEGDPEDAVAAARLAQIYLQNQHDPAQARQVLDNLLKARETAHVRWVRYLFFTMTKDRKQAAAELDAARKLAPENVVIRVRAAKEALRRGDIEAAKKEIYGCDLRLMPSVKDVSDIQAQGKDLLVVAAVGPVLHFRIFDGDEKVLDTDEQKLTKDAGQIEALRKRLQGLWPPHKITRDEKDGVLNAVTSIVGHREINALPESSLKTITEGEIAFAEQHPEEGILDWQQGLQMTGGTDDELIWRLAYTYLQKNELTMARRYVARYREIVGEQAGPRLALLEAELDLRSGLPARARDRMERLRNQVDDETQKVPFLLTLGHAYEQLWEHENALQVYHQASEISPEEQDPRMAAVQVRIRQQKFAEARAEVERGLQAIPDAAALMITRARLLLREQALRPRDRRSWDEFNETVKQASELAPNSPSLALLLTDFLTLDGNVQEAINRLKLAVDRHPRIDTIAIAYANSLARAGRVEEALQVLDQASNPDAAGDHASLRINRANLLLGLGRGRTARDALVHDIDRLPITERALIWRTLGQLEASQGNLDGARDAYLENARLSPDEPQPWLDLLVLAMTISDEAAVRSIVEEIKRRSEEREGPQSGGSRPTASVYHDLVWPLCRVQELLWSTRTSTGQPSGRVKPAIEEARQLLDGLLLDAPEMPVAHLFYGDLLERHGGPDDAEKAIAHYRRAWDRGADVALPRLVRLLNRPDKTKELDEIRKSISESRPAQPSPLSPAKPGDSGTPAGPIPAVAQRPDVLEARLRQLRELSLRGDTKQVTKTIEEIRKDFPAENPDLIEARCRWATNDLPKADEAFKVALERSHDDPTVSRFASAYYEEHGRRGEAVACLRRSLKAHPEDRPNTRTLALLLAAAATDESSWQAALDVLGPEPKDREGVDDRLARAIVLSYSRDPAKEEAIAHFEALIEDIPTQSPQAPLARSLLAGLLLKTGRPARAAQLASISANAGTDPAAISLYAEALIQAQKWDEAQFQIDRFQALGPQQSARAAQLQVQLIQAQAGPKDAVRTLEESLDSREKTPNLAIFEYEVFKTLNQIGPSATEAAERVAGRIARRTPAFSWMLAKIQLRKEKYAEALASCRQAVEHYDGTFDNLLQVGDIAIQIALAKKAGPEISDSAEAVLKDAQAREPKSVILLIGRAVIAHPKAKYDDEIGFYRKILELEPSNAVALNNIAWCLSEGKNQASEGLTYIDTLMQQQGGKSAQPLDTRGVILARLGRYDEAIRDLSESNRMAPSEVTLFHLAVAYHLAGREDDFRKTRDVVRQAKLKPDQLEPGERSAFETLIQR
jgi:tetratricopeptide (TPR) repeat protein